MADLKAVNTGASVVGIAAKGASIAGIGGTAAAAALPVVGWAAAAVSLAATIFGSKKESSVLQGFEVAGGLSKSGFRGTVVAYDQLGNRWDASGERGGLEKFTAAELITGNEALPASQAAYYDRIFGDRTVAVSFKSGADNARLMPTLAGFASNVSATLERESAAQSSATALLDQLNNRASAGAPSFKQAEYDRLYSIVDLQHRDAYGIPLAESPDKSGLELQLEQLRSAATVIEAPTLTSDMPAPVIPSDISVTPATGTATGGAVTSGATGSSAGTSQTTTTTPASNEAAILIGLALVVYLATRA